MPSGSDRDAIRALLGRDSISRSEVALRCPGGGPAVLRNRPVDNAGRPFPTRYWLACRALARAVSRLEAAGGVRQLEHESALADDLRAAQQRHARIHGGHFIGGVRDPERVKCLHAHLAFGLVEGGAVGEWIIEHAAAVWPERCCVDELIAESP